MKNVYMALRSGIFVAVAILLSVVLSSCESYITYMPLNSRGCRPLVDRGNLFKSKEPDEKLKQVQPSMTVASESIVPVLKPNVNKNVSKSALIPKPSVLQPIGQTKINAASVNQRANGTNIAIQKRNDYVIPLDRKDEYFKRYFHFTLWLLFLYWWIFLSVFTILAVLSYMFLPKRAANWAVVVFLVFTFIGALQGNIYYAQGSRGAYIFWNIFFLPAFFVFNFGIAPYFIILCISIKEHRLARRASQTLAERRKETKRAVEYHEDKQEFGREGIMLPDIPHLRNKMQAIGEYFLDKSKDSTPTFDIEYLEDVKTSFLSQFKFISEKKNTKLNLLIQHVNGLIEYERARNRLEHVEGEKRLDDARRYTEYKKLQAECMKHELEIVRLSKEMENIQGTKLTDPLTDIKERLRLENEKTEVYLDYKVKRLRSECANNINMKRELRKLLTEETIKISGGKERDELSFEQLRELEDVEDYIQAEIDRL